MRSVWRSTSLGLLVLASFFVASQSNAFTLDWTTIGWNPNDTSGLQEFANVDGSGIDLAVSYTLNAFLNDGVPLLYTEATSPTDEILGSLRFLNQTSDPTTPVTVTLTFSQDIFIDQAFLYSHSIIGANRQEHSVVVARDVAGSAIAASEYDTTTPGLVELDMDGDAFYESIGLGFQNEDEYGTVFYEYQQTGIRSISYSLFVFETDTSDFTEGGASMGIGAVDFSPVPMPEPSTGLLAMMGLAGLALHSHRSRFAFRS